MIFDDLMIENAEGAILAHTWRLADRVLKKGHRLSAEDLKALAAAGETWVTAARLDALDSHEDQAAADIAHALRGANLRATTAFTGRCNIVSERAGVVILDKAALGRVNEVDEAITVATLPPFATVRPRQVVATVKIIPFGVADKNVHAATTILEGLEAIRVAPFQPKRVAALLTHLPGYKESLLEKSESTLSGRLRDLGAELMPVCRCPHDKNAVSEWLSSLLEAGCDLAVVGGATAIMDRRDVIPAAIEQAGGTIERFGMPVDPGNLLLLGRVGTLPVIGMPGCARSIKENGFDWVLARLMADLPVTSSDIAAMGSQTMTQRRYSFPMPARSPLASITASR